MSSEDEPRDGYSVVVSQATFERMKDDQNIHVTDYADMGSHSEHDVFVGFRVNRQENEEKLVLWCDHCEDYTEWDGDSLTWYCSECVEANLTTEEVRDRVGL